jgi:hypothetical protein
LKTRTHEQKWVTLQGVDFQTAVDFKSFASADFATRADGRLARTLHSKSADAVEEFSDAKSDSRCGAP